MTISNKLWASVLALISVATPVLPSNSTPIKGQTLKPTAATKAACIPTTTKTNIGLRYAADAGNLPGNPNPTQDSYNDFLFSVGAFYCIPNTTINGSASSSTPTTYKKVMYALKKATDTSPVPANSTYTLFKPFKWKTTGNCSGTQIANGWKLNIITPINVNSTTATIKLCQDILISGIGDTARAKTIIRNTISYYYAPLLTTIILKDRYGNVMN